MPLTGSRDAESLVGYRGNAPALGPQAKGNWRLSRIRRIRETAKTATTKKITLVPASCTEKGDPFCLLPCDLLVDFCAATSFSTVRKKHTGPRQSKTVAGFASSTQALTTLVAQMRDLTRARGGAKRPSSDSLTFTHHFHLRRSPHWGPVMRKRPLWTLPVSSWYEVLEPSPCATASQVRLEAVLVVVCRCAARLRSRVAVGTSGLLRVQSP